MNWLRIQYIKNHKAKAYLYAGLFVFVILAFVYFRDTFVVFFSSPETVREWVLGYGPWAPVALLALQIIQVVVAPLNNFFVNVAGGFIFGPWEGFLYSYVGWMMGAILVFWFSRWFGRAFVQVFIRIEELEGFDDLMSRGRYLLFILFLLPGPPDDFLVYFLGISKSIPFRTFLWMIAIGKIPGKLATSFLGAGAADHNLISVGIYAVFIIGSLVVFWRKPELWRIWERDRMKKHLDEQEQAQKTIE